jgi:hypothetical protein
MPRVAHRRDERLLIDNFAARGVDEVSAFAHRVEKVRLRNVFVSGFNAR